MKTTKCYRPSAWLISLALLLSSCLGMFNQDATAQSETAQAHRSTRARASKVAPDLDELVRAADSRGETVRLIVQTNGDPGENLKALLRRDGAKVNGSFRNLNAHVVEVPARMVEELANDGDVSYISPDREVKTLGHVTMTTGADAVRASAPGGGGALDGSGVGIAVLDSSIYTTHQSFKGRSGER